MYKYSSLKIKIIILILTYIGLSQCTANKPTSRSKDKRGMELQSTSDFSGSLVSSMITIQDEAVITQKTTLDVCYLTSCINKRQFGKYISPAANQSNKKLKKPFLLIIPGKMGITNNFITLVENFVAFDYTILVIDLYALTFEHSAAEIKDESVAEEIYNRVEVRNEQITENSPIQIKEAIQWLTRKDSTRNIVLISWDVALYSIKTFLSFKNNTNKITGLINYYGDPKILESLSGPFNIEAMLHIIPQENSQFSKIISKSTQNKIKSLLRVKTKSFNQQQSNEKNFEIAYRASSHGFMEPNRSSKYNQEETAIAIEKTLIFLKQLNPEEIDL